MVHGRRNEVASVSACRPSPTEKGPEGEETRLKGRRVREPFGLSGGEKVSLRTSRPKENHREKQKKEKREIFMTGELERKRRLFQKVYIEEGVPERGAQNPAKF